MQVCYIQPHCPLASMWRKFSRCRCHGSVVHVQTLPAQCHVGNYWESHEFAHRKLNFTTRELHNSYRSRSQILPEVSGPWCSPTFMRLGSGSKPVTRDHYCSKHPTDKVSAHRDCCCNFFVGSVGECFITWKSIRRIIVLYHNLFKFWYRVHAAWWNKSQERWKSIIISAPD